MSTSRVALSYRPLKVSPAIVSLGREMINLTELEVTELLDRHSVALSDANDGMMVYVIPMVKTSEGGIYALATQPGTGERKLVIGHIEPVNVSGVDSVRRAVLRTAEQALNETFTFHDERSYVGPVDLQGQHTKDFIEYCGVLVRDGAPGICLVYNYTVPDSWSVKLTRTAKDLYRRVKHVHRDAFIGLGYPAMRRELQQ